MLSSYLHCIYLEINTCLFMHFTIEVMDISFFAETKVFKNHERPVSGTKQNLKNRSPAFKKYTSTGGKMQLRN